MLHSHCCRSQHAISQTMSTSIMADESYEITFLDFLLPYHK